MLTFQQEQMIWEPKHHRFQPSEEVEMVLGVMLEQEQALEEKAYQKWLSDLNQLGQAIRAEADEEVVAEGTITICDSCGNLEENHDDGECPRNFRED